MKKITLLLLSLTLSTSLFIGCGGNSAASTDDSSKPSTSEDGTSKDDVPAEEGSEDTSGEASEEESSEAPAEPSAKDITIEEAKKLIDDGEVTLILDVRTEEEYAEGHLENAIPIAAEELKDSLADIEKFKDQLVLVYCQTGNRSSDAMNILKENGFTNLVHMKDGIAAWDGEIVK